MQESREVDAGSRNPVIDERMQRVKRRREVGAARSDDLAKRRQRSLEAGAFRPRQTVS